MRVLVPAVSTLAVVTATSALAADVTISVQEQFPEEYFEGNKAAGYIDLHYGFANLQTEADLPDLDWRSAGIAGRANLPFSPGSGLNLQIDGTADRLLYVQGNSAGSTPIEATGHLSYRNPDRFALGAFGSYGRADPYELYGGGVEGQLFWNRVTLYGQGGYRHVDQPNNFVNEWYVRGVGRWFPTDNTRIEGEIGYAWYDPDKGTGNDDTFWSVSAEYRFDHMPIGIYGQYRGDYLRPTEEGKSVPLTINTFLFGIRGYLGSDSLFDNDRRGASFDEQRLEQFLFIGI